MGKKDGIITLYILFTREQRERGTGIRESEPFLSRPLPFPVFHFIHLVNGHDVRNGPSLFISFRSILSLSLDSRVGEREIEGEKGKE